VCVWHYLWKMAQNILAVIVFLCFAHYKSVVKLNTPVVLNVLRKWCLQGIYSTNGLIESRSSDQNVWMYTYSTYS